MAISILLAGLISGWLLGVFGPQVTPWAEFRQSQISGTTELILVADKIRSGKEYQLVENAEAHLPIVVRSIAEDKDFSNSPNGQAVLWHARRYYEKHGVKVPAEIQPIFESLPADHPIACSFRKEVHWDQ